MSGWNIILQLMAGLGIFIYGMTLLTNSLKTLTLSKIKTVFEKLTSNRIKAFLTGVGITAIIQSSSATSVILMGFLNVGLMSLVMALPIIVGANIGTTITAQIIAFKLTKVAPIFIFAGLVMNFVAKKRKHKNWGLAILAFGLLFFGLQLMSGSVKPLAGNEDLLAILASFGRNPILGILAGVVITMIFQSSSTTIGMTISLAITGLLDFPSAFYIVLGDNIGTCITAVIASIGSNYSSKRLALGHTLFKVIGTVIAVILSKFYLTLVPLTSGDIARQIANSHTIFNVFNALIFLPFIPLYAKLLEKIIPQKDYAVKETRFLDDKLLKAPKLAINAVSKEMIVMLDICKDILTKAKNCLGTFDHKLYAEAKNDENSVDLIQVNITQYLIKIIGEPLSEKDSRKIPSLLHSVNDIERIGDHCEAILELAQKKYEDDIKFSREARKHIYELININLGLIKTVKSAINNDSKKLALKSLEIEEEINLLFERYKESHLVRMRKKTCDFPAALIYTDLLTHLEKIGDYLANVSDGILYKGKRGDDKISL